MNQTKSTSEKQIRRIGILGGTFDPIHLGHLIIAQEAYEHFGLDKVLLMPTGHSYFKDHREEKVSDPKVRLEMTRAAAAGDTRFEVSDLEVLRPGNSYTAQTLTELQAANPDERYFYIVGADTLCMMRSWYQPQTIFDLCTVLAAVRSDQTDNESFQQEAEALRADFGARIEMLPVRRIDLSSTEIRARVREGKSISYFVNAPVEDYILRHHLYTEQPILAAGEQT